MEFIENASSSICSDSETELFPSAKPLASSVLPICSCMKTKADSPNNSSPSSLSSSPTVAGSIKVNNLSCLPNQPFESSELECSLCFRLLCRPVSTPCGHTYCKSCLLSALKFSLLCPLCRSKLEPSSKYKYSVNIVILTLLEKHFKEDLEQREKEEDEEEQDTLVKEENATVELEDYYTRWSNCLIPSVRETCSVLLSCT